MMRIPALALALTLGACTTSQDMGRENVVLIEPDQGQMLLAQCSRPSAPNDGEFFTPSAGDITALETDLGSVLQSERSAYLKPGDPAGAFDWPLDPSSYVRQYVGYESNGRRMIYGNFLPGSTVSGPSRPAVVCDGGPQFFGVEYDVAARQVVRVAFNGGLAGPFYQPILRPLD